MRILLTGVTGQVGGALRVPLSAIGIVLAPDRTMLDLSSPNGIGAALDAMAPDLIVNPAAYTAVDRGVGCRIDNEIWCHCIQCCPYAIRRRQVEHRSVRSQNYPDRGKRHAKRSPHLPRDPSQQDAHSHLPKTGKADRKSVV